MKYVTRSGLDLKYQFSERVNEGSISQVTKNSDQNDDIKRILYTAVIFGSLSTLRA